MSYRNRLPPTLINYRSEQEERGNLYWREILLSSLARSSGTANHPVWTFSEPVDIIYYCITTIDFPYTFPNVNAGEDLVFRFGFLLDVDNKVLDSRYFVENNNVQLGTTDEINDDTWTQQWLELHFSTPVDILLGSTNDFAGFINKNINLSPIPGVLLFNVVNNPTVLLNSNGQPIFSGGTPSYIGSSTALNTYTETHPESINAYNAAEAAGQIFEFFPPGDGFALNQTSTFQTLVRSGFYPPNIVVSPMTALSSINYPSNNPQPTLTFSFQNLFNLMDPLYYGNARYGNNGWAPTFNDGGDGGITWWSNFIVCNYAQIDATNAPSLLQMLNLPQPIIDYYPLTSFFGNYQFPRDQGPNRNQFGLNNPNLLPASAGQFWDIGPDYHSLATPMQFSYAGSARNVQPRFPKDTMVLLRSNALASGGGVTNLLPSMPKISQSSLQTSLINPTFGADGSITFAQYQQAQPQQKLWSVLNNVIKELDISTAQPYSSILWQRVIQPTPRTMTLFTASTLENLDFYWTTLLDGETEIDLKGWPFTIKLGVLCRNPF